MRVLVAEDDSGLRDALARGLRENGYVVDTVADGEAAVRFLRSYEYAVVVLDWRMPRMSGLEVLHWLRRRESEAAVLMLTARDAPADRVTGLDHGADDYLVKPFSCEHLAARIAAVLRRNGAADGGHQVLTVGGLRVDLAAREASLDGRPLQLSRREFDLLGYLAARPDQVVARRELLSDVWHQSYGDDQTIDVHVSWLRRKLGESAAAPRYLHTVRGVGVKLASPR